MTDPNIALQVRPMQVQSPIDSLHKAVSIADMLAQVSERQQIAKQRAAEAPLRAAAAAAQMDELKEKSTLKNAFDLSVKYNQETGDIDYDVPKAAQYFANQKMPHLMDAYQSQMDKNRAEHRTQAINEAKAHSDQLALVATPAENFLALPEDQKKAAWPDLRTNITAFDKTVGKVLPYDYDPAVIDPKLQKIVQAHKQTQTVKEKLEEAQERAKLQNIEDDKLPIEDLWKKNGGTGAVPQQFRDKVIAARAGVTAPAASTYTQETALRKLGLRTNATTGDVESIPRDQLSPRELADLEYREAGDDLRKAQADAAKARAEMDRAKADPNSIQYKQAAARLAIAQQNAKTAQDRLGIEREAADARAEARKTGSIADRQRAITNINSLIKAAYAEPGSKEAKAIWDREKAHYPDLNLPEYEGAPKPPAASAVPAKPKATGKSAKRADVIAAGAKANISAADAIKRWTDAGNTVLP